MASKRILAFLMGIAGLLLQWPAPAFGQISSIIVTPSNSAAGEETIYEVQFTTSVDILNNDQLVFDFPSGFDASSVIVASAISGMDGGLTVTSTTTTQVVLTRDGTGTTVIAGNPVTVRFGNVKNHTVAATIYTLNVTLKDNGGTTTKDSGTSSAFTITPNQLHHFSVTNSSGGLIGTQTAGVSFDIRVIAQDAYNNTVTSFTGTVAIDDVTGTISPTTSGNFVAGVLATQTVTITESNANNKITVSSGSVTGVSNTFTVDPASLDHFTLSSIASPQTAGTAFSVTITAEDAYGNKVTSFNGTVGISVSSGTVTPTTSGSFVNGVRTESINVLTAGTGLTITVDDGASHIGTSNAFDVNPGALDHFRVTAQGGGNIGTQTAGTAFSIAITAQDAYNNTVTSFTGSVTLSDATGTISPTTSANFTNGVLASQSVTITKASSNVTITATASGKSGTSNGFTVSPAALDHFTISAISSPQTAGTAFPITITAQDVYNNTVTNFVGTVNISISSGTVTPTTSGTFSSGVRTESINVLTAGTALTLSVDDGAGITGTSNNFDVNPGALDHFEITAPDGSNIAVQQVGVPFDIRIEAHDSNHNIVTGFVDLVTLSDLTGTISPTTSATFNSGVLNTQSVTISSTQTSNKITATGSGKSGTSNAFDVNPGPLHHIILRTAANNGGVEFVDYQMTADDSVTIYAAGYDIGNTYLGDVSVTWSSTGALAPAVSGTGSSFTFKPTTASVNGTTGTIVGTHATAGSDATGTITVTPGVPSGTLTLTATPQAIPADGASTSTITSSIVTDADGNAVGAGRQFTIIQPLVGTVPDTQDVNPTLDGIQVQTNSSSQLSFLFKADTVGGEAIISVASVNGSATGNTKVTVGNLQIASINAPQFVTRGQLDAQVTMAVRNIGTASISLNSASLTFTGSGGFDRAADYPIITRGDTISVIPGGTTANLVFLVDVSNTATIDTITIDGAVSGTIGGTTVSDNGADSTAQWVVQKPADIVVQSITGPDSVAQGQQNIDIAVWLANSVGDGQAATAEIDSIIILFRKGAADVTSQYIVAESGSNPTTLAGGSRAALHFTVNVGAAADTGQVIIDARAYGKDQNARTAISDANGADTTHTWNVSTAAALQIVSITPSQASVTSGMTKQWIVKMAVANNSSSTIQLDLSATATYIRFFSGTNNVTSEYSITQPTQLKNGGIVLGPSITDTLEFVITQTGTTTGTIIISGRVAGTDLGPSLPVSDDTNDGGKGQVSVQSPANLQITSVEPSQATATVNQTRPWTIAVNVKNAGGADIRLTFQTDSTTISLADTNGYRLTYPAQLSGGGAILSGNSSGTLVFTVDTTGSNLGVNTVNAIVSGFEINTGTFLSDTTTTANDTSFVVQTPAVIRIDSTFIDTTTAPNPPFVNNKQAYNIKVLVSNSGQETVDSLQIQLTSNGVSAIGAQTPTYATVPGNGSTTVSIAVTAPDFETLETFTAQISRAVTRNTKTVPTVLQPLDSTEAVQSQIPAGLQVLKVVASDTAVSANQISPWKIYVVVKDTGSSGILFQPQASDITFKMNGVVRTDFEVAPPTKLNGRANLFLPGGEIDTLAYTVNRTGKQGGRATIIAQVSGYDINDRNGLTATDSTEIAIETSAFVRIIDTSPIVNNLISQDIGRVNIGQVFQIKVTVENAGLEPVKDVVLQLQTAGPSQILAPIDTIASLAAQSTASVFFTVRADSSVNATGEDFQSQILAATAVQSGKPAPIRAPSDDFTRILIERAALLDIRASTIPSGGKLAVGQTFTFSALVKNLGDAGLAAGGKVFLKVPQNYATSDALIRDFTANTPVNWSVTAPSVPSGPDTFVVSIFTIPNDINIDAPAAVARQIDTLIVETDTTRIKIDSLYVSAPNGAKDDTLSTDQLFTLALRIDRTPNLPNINATLRLPPGYSFRFGPADSSKNLPLGTTTTFWDVRTPSLPSAGLDPLVVRVFGVDAKNNLIEAYDTLRVMTVLRAQLKVSTRIISPPGAETGSLARGQTFVLRAFIENQGTARTVGTAELRLDPGTTGVTTSDTLVKQVDVGGFVDWELTAPDTVSSQKPITVRIHRTPKDENTDQIAAWVQNGRATLLVETREVGKITANALQITSPIGATDRVLSTEQKFTIGTTLNWTDVSDIQAEVVLPAGFTATDKIVQPNNKNTTGTEFLNWEIKAPKSRLDQASIYVRISGRDAADTTRLSATSDTLTLQVVNKAMLTLRAEIVDPPTATDGVVTTDLEFTVRAIVQNQPNAAGVVGSDSIRMTLPAGYTTNDPAVKSTQDGVAEWRIKAPSAPHNEPRSIKFAVLAHPRDENSEEIVFITPSEVQISILTERSKLVVQEVPFNLEPTISAGQTDVPLIKLQFENTGSPGSSNILVKQITVDVFDREGQPLQASDVFAALKITREADNTLFAQKAAVPGNTTVELNFLQDAVLEPQYPIVFVISADISQNAKLNAFNLRLSSQNQIGAVDQDSDQPVSVELLNQEGQKGAIETGKMVLIDRKFSNSFFNRPNPFGSADRPITKFIYHLEKDSNVTLRIYTLFGELVWEKTFTASDPQGRADGGPKIITWNGTNGRGIRVLNGVYLAVLTTNAGTVTTKVAVIR
ncbi:MAG: hypothetical protein Q9P90_10310 [candidate division KSB1 bacterium]|nr:hypothetical protein [candidate division KSB1 bacterium]